MELSEFTFKLLLLFFPGILCAYLIDQLTVHRPRETFSFLLQSFVCGIFSYFTYWFVLKSINYISPGSVNDQVTFLRALTTAKTTFSFREIAFTCIIAAILAAIASYASQHKILNRTARYIKITKKFGELDVWGYILNTEEFIWVTVRDHKNDLIYDGWVQAFSDDSKDAELLLKDVSIYKNSTGERLYQVGAVYLSRAREDISIECRTIPINEQFLWMEVNNSESKQRGTQTTTTSQATK